MSKDTTILENLYALVLEFKEPTIKKLVAKFQKDDDTLTEETIRQYLQRFEKFKANPKIVKKDPFQYKWKELEYLLDANFPNNDEEAVEGSESLENYKDSLKVYEDDNIVIHKASNQKQTILLGNGYTFCISRAGEGNMYIGYRLRAGSTFYFVKFKHKTSAKNNEQRFVDPSHMIVVDAQSNGKFQWTYADNGSQGNGTKDATPKEMEEKIPELKPAFEKGVFKNDPISNEERAKLKKFQDGNFKELTYNEKEEYIKAGYNRNVVLIDLDKKLRNEYLGIGHDIYAAEVKTLSMPELRRWMTIRAMITSSSPNMALNFSTRLLRAGVDVSKIPKDTIDTISKDAYSSFTFGKTVAIYKGVKNNIPESILNTVSKSTNCFSFLTYLVNDAKYSSVELPQILLDGLAKHGVSSLIIFVFQILKLENVSKNVLLAISKNSQSSYYYVKALIYAKKYTINEISPILFKTISKNLDTSMSLVISCVSTANEIPEVILKTITTSCANSKRVIEKLILDKGASINDIPQALINSVATDCYTALFIAEKVLYGKNVPEVIINALMNSSATSAQYASFLASNVNINEIPESIIAKIATNPHNSQFFAAALKGKNVPQTILDAISRSYQATMLYLTYLQEIGKTPNEVPKQLFDKLKPEHKKQIFGKLVESLRLYIKQKQVK